MKHNPFRALLLSVTFAGLVFAQKPQTAKTNSTEANLRRTIEYLASDKLAGRRAGEPGAALAARYVADQFAKVKLKAGVSGTNGKRNYLQPFSFTPVRDPHSAAPASELSTPAKRYDTANVIGILPGTDPQLKNEAIVIGAHYDHLGHGGDGSLAANSIEIHHGADDNASGVAAIIELARQFARDKRNKRTLIFIAFSGEEEGLFGSNFYVNNPVFPLDKTIAMINLDMVGRLKDNKLTVGGTGTASDWKTILERLNSAGKRPSSVGEDKLKLEIDKALTKIGINSVNVDVEGEEVSLSGYVPKDRLPEVMKAVMEFDDVKKINNRLFVRETRAMRYPSVAFQLQLNEDGFGPSDHSSFYGKKIPVLFFFTGTHNDYHKPSDTSDKINYGGEHGVINFVWDMVNAIDETLQRPTYAVAKSSNTGGRTGFKISLGTIPNYADSTDGMLIDGVRDDTPAAKAGLKTGDKVVKLAGRDIRNVYDYTDTLVDMKAGEEYEIVVLRSGEKLMLKIVPVKR